ncbi:formylmethanofuran dehydrogenase subunit E [Thermodesulfovibrio aggregans]|uniref:Formylmethanofuran dehydrogenase subunit E n=1 Tax=Thermodesulfovibrio aggregans TaxID=86166 RepID=A0A0U9HW30_9BACT|nr:formylmethanofuran dehydrogenase subunit E family protein [Thermodesulfovibrio aggregans]GAQ95121.1 formylmethanofuran dehydrogenase subunit E [Thermodesulfovibrio aggregans]
MKELLTVLETGYNHGAGCFGDGVQFATDCTAGKGNLIKKPRGKLAFTLIDPKQGKQIFYFVSLFASREPVFPS